MSRAVMQQALEALVTCCAEEWRTLNNFGMKQVYDEKKVNAAIAALHAALAEPEQIEDAIVYGSAWSKDGKRIDPMSVYKEPEQNPFGDDAERYARKLHEEREYYKALFTAPTPRKPLTDAVVVPLEILEAAEASLGSFCSDLGWSAEDMQNMDNLSAYIAKHKAAHGITGEQT